MKDRKSGRVGFIYEKSLRLAEQLFSKGRYLWDYCARGLQGEYSKMKLGEIQVLLQLMTVTNDDLKQYKAMVQDAFQKGFEDQLGKSNETILPDEDIDQSLNAKGSVALKAVVDGEMVGGAVVVIDKETQHNHLDLLFVKNGMHSKGIGKAIWFEIEKLFPNTKGWETCTPYFDKRNIHFYVNVCQFHIVEFFNEKHPMPNAPEDFIGDGNEGMFQFFKQM